MNVLNLFSHPLKHANSKWALLAGRIEFSGNPSRWYDQ